MFYYNCYGLDLASDHAIKPLDSVQKETDTAGSLKIIWSPPPFANAQWKALSAGKSRDKKRIKISKGLHEGNIVYRFHRNTVQLGHIYSYFDPVQNILWYMPDNSLSVSDSQSVLVGAVLGSCISFSGTLCLHASAIEYNGSAILFLGPSGTGKSTTALHMSQYFGTKFITDDIAVIGNDEQYLTVAPGYQKLRVLPEDVARIDAQISNVKDPVYTHMTKAYFEVKAANKPVPISTIISLKRSSENEKIIINRKKGVEAYIDCIPHIFSREAYVKSSAFAAQSKSLKDLIIQAEYCVLDVPDGHQHMTDICSKVMEMHNARK